MGSITSMFKKPKAPDYSKLEFSPYAVTGPTGGVTFDKGAKTADISLSPEIQSFMDMYLGAAMSAVPSAEQTQFATDLSGYGKGLFGQAISADPTQRTADYYNQQLNLLAPQRAAEDVRLAERLYGTGTTELGTSLGTGGYVNPQAYSQQLAREQTNLAMLTGAEDRSRAMQTQDIANALQYYGAGQDLAYAPYQQAGGLLSQGINLGNLATPYAGIGIQLGQGAQQAGQSIVGAQQRYDQQLRSGGVFGDLLSGFAGAGGFNPVMNSLPSVSGLFSGFGSGGYTGGGTFMPQSSSFAGNPALRSS